VALAIAALGVAGVGIFLALRPSTSAQTASPTPTPDIAGSKTGAIAALGRLEPGGETYCVYPPSSSGLSSIIKLWKVREGDRVKQGDVIAVMDTYDRLTATLIQAQAQVAEAESRIAQAQQGAKPGEINAQSALIAARAEQAGAKVEEIRRKESERNNAKIELERAEKLVAQGAISLSQRDLRQTTFNGAQAALNQAIREKQQLEAEIQQAIQAREGLAQVRPVDVQQAVAQRDVAVANLQRANVEQATAAVVAPISGRVLKIHAKEAEQVSSGVGGSTSSDCRGVAELGETDRMYAVAEVYETDIVRVRQGQKATITSTVFPDKLTGTVEKVALRVGKKDVLNTDPAADTDARVVEVKIRLDDSKVAAGLTNLKVKVEINP
jgi:HlyD family secretion protein